MRQAQRGLFGTALDELDRARRKKQQRDAETLERLAKRAGLDPQTAARLALNLQPTHSENWKFIMISPHQNAAVVRGLTQTCSRPKQAMLLWSVMLTAVRYDTGEVLMTREEMAQHVGCSPNNISTIMKSLERMNAVLPFKRGREKRYRLNPTVGTHIPDPDARSEARAEAGPLLTLMTGGAT